MRTSLVMVLLTLAVVPAATAGTPPPWTHTRPLTPTAAQVIADATRRSPLVASMLQELERTNVVVYVSDSMSGRAEEPQAYLTFVAYAAGTRYLLVRLDRWCVRPSERMVWLGHELKHALEVAAAPDVKNAVGLARLYRHIGWEGPPGRFETDLAQAVSLRVRNQIAGLDSSR